MRKSLIQQGDVLIHIHDSIDLSSMKKVKSVDGRYILREGEATGHAHAVLDVPTVELYEDDRGTLFLKVAEDTEVTHEEHGTVTIPGGSTVEIGAVREVDPFEDEIRYVAD